MSKGNWSLDPPVGVGLICFALLMFSGLENYRQERTGYQQATAEEYGVAAQPRPIPTPPANPVPERGEWRSERDLQAQRDMAKWAFWMVVISGVGVVITGVGVLFVRETLEHTRQANALNRKAFEEAERPLFFVSIIDMEREEPDSNSLADRFESYARAEEEMRNLVQYIELHNVGTRPAFGVSLRTVIGFEGSSDERFRSASTGMAEIAPGAKPREFISFASGSPSITERLAAGETLHITGWFVYDDALGIRRERGFKFLGGKNTGLWAYVITGIQWERVNDPAVNYDRRIEG